MAIQTQGFSGIVAEVEASRASRVAQRPTDLGALGAYSLSVDSGIMAAGLAANSEVFQFRWTSAAALMVVRSIRFGAGSIAAFAAGFLSVKVRVARAWTADGTGGTAVTFGVNDNKKRTSFPTTLAPSGAGVRVATTAALGAGTKTLDGNDFASAAGGIIATAGSTLIPPGTFIWSRDTGDEYPLVLAQNEGFVVRSTVPATGTWTFSVNIEWSEFATF